MKKVFLNGVAIMMSLMLVFTSCSKEQQIISPTSNGSDGLIEILESVNAQYGVENSIEFTDTDFDSRKKKWWKILLADAKGFVRAFDGDNWLEAGLASAVASADYADGAIIINGPAVTNIPYIELTPENPNNAYDNVGVWHNLALEDMYNNYASLSNVDGLDFMKLYGFSWNTLGGSFQNIKSVSDLQDIVNDSKSSLWELKKMNVISKTERDILLLYKKGIKKLANINSFYSYTESFENNIAADKSLGNDSQKTLLGFLSVAKHSRTYWANKKF